MDISSILSPKSSPSIAIVVVITAVITFLATIALIWGILFVLRKKRRAQRMAKAMAEAKAELEAVEGGKAQVEIPLGLSPRESEIFTLLLTEAAPKDIAYNLNISNSAVNKHILNIYRKLNVQSRVELFAKFSSQSIKNG